jgi:hypothetical protein
LDFDALRLGKRVVEDNINKDAFEFGVVNITEVGKERGNNLELKEMMKKATGANQKNDLFNAWLKMVRHSATVDNFPFVKVFTDEQRPSSWGADARDLCEVVHIRDCSDTGLAMPFFALGELLYSWVFGRFVTLYRDFRYARGDNTLFMYIAKGAAAWLHRYYTRIYNQFSFTVLDVRIEDGVLDGKYDENKYYLMSKKIYGKRFSTDCFSDFFKGKALRSPIGLDDLREYRTEKAAFAELAGQNSYFINDLINMERSGQDGRE